MESLKEFLIVTLLIGYLIAMFVSFARWRAFQHLIRRRLGSLVVLVSGFILFLALGGHNAFISAIAFALMLAIAGAMFGGPFGAVLLGSFGLIGGFCYGLTLIGQ